MMDYTGNKFYHDGKRARSLGCSRTIDDGRLAPDSREAWKRGWDDQDAMENQPKESEEEKAERKREVRDELEAFKASLN